MLIDSPALMHLFGTKIDFVQDRLRYIVLTFIYSMAALRCQLVAVPVASLFGGVHWQFLLILVEY